MTRMAGLATPGDGRTGCRGVPARILLVPLRPELPEPALLDWLAAELGGVFGAEVTRESPMDAEARWRSGEGSQLDSSAIVDSLIGRYGQDGGGRPRWVLVVTAADLRGGGRDFVFGEAAVGGAWAVIGTARFGAAGEEPFRTRVLKEALHELGHVAGLDHCSDPGCLMAPSKDVEALDRKGLTPCPGCREKLTAGEP